MKSVMMEDSQRLEQMIEGALDSAKETSKSPPLSIEQLSWLAQLMTIWTSAYLETSCRETMVAYAKTRSAPGVLKYVDHQLQYFRSPRTKAMIRLVGWFDQRAADELETLSEGQIAASIDSIVTDRHALAHGRPARVTVHSVRSYFEDARRFTRKMHALMGVTAKINPHRPTSRTN